VTRPDLPIPSSDESALVSTVPLSGEYDIARAADLRHAVLDDDDGASVVVLDFAEVTFVDSSGLRALLDVATQLDRAGREVRLAHLPAQVRTLLEVTGTLDLFVVDGQG